LYSSPSKITIIKTKGDEIGREFSTNREERTAYMLLVGKPEGKRPRRRWVDNIMMHLREIW
jgi:hypothetical protein